MLAVFPKFPRMHLHYQHARTQSDFREHMRQLKQWQRRGGGARNVGGRGGGRGGRFGDRQGGKARQPSVQVKPEWQVLQELDFQQLGRLSLPNVEPAEDM